MSARRAASHLLFALGCVLLAAALILLLTAFTLPAAGLEDLGRIVGAMLLGALAAIPFAASLLVARRPSRGLLATAAAGSLLGGALGATFLSAGVLGATLLGAASALAGVAGVVAAARHWTRPKAHPQA